MGTLVTRQGVRYSTAQEVESLHSLGEQSFSTPDSQRDWDQCKTQTENLAAPADEY